MNKSTLYIWQLNSIIKNIFTAIVVIALLISISGFQVYKHTCSAHSFSAVSLIDVPVCEEDHSVTEAIDDCCKSEVEEITEPSCYESESIGDSNSIAFTSQEIECCVSSIESSQIQENLFTPAEKKIITLNIITTILPDTEKKSLKTKQNLVLLNIDLPPPIFGKQLLHSIHQLKLDTPIC